MEGKMFNIKKLCKAVLLSLIISVIFVGIFSAVVCFTDISDGTVSAVIFAISVVSVLIGALVLAKNIDCGGLLNGLFTALGYFAVLTAATLLINGSVGFDMHNILRFAACLGAGMLGGVLGINSVRQS